MAMEDFVQVRFDMEDVGKYLKKKESDVSKSERKAKHKHQYKDCLFLLEYFKDDPAAIGEYCELCGKIKNYIFPSRRIEKSGLVFHVMMNKEEILEAYKELPVFVLKEWGQKYVETKEVKSDE